MKYDYIDLEYLYHLADDDKEFVAEIIHNFLENTPQQLEKLTSFIHQGDEKETIFAAHKLKGSFRFIGCTKVGAMLEQIELNPRTTDTSETALLNRIKEDYVHIEEDLKNALVDIEAGR